jgi:hypothetical protein
MPSPSSPVSLRSRAACKNSSTCSKERAGQQQGAVRMLHLARQHEGHTQAAAALTASCKQTSS